MSKKKIIISIVLLVLIANAFAGVKLYKIINKNLEVVDGLDINLTEQKDFGEWVEVTMVMTNNSKFPILDHQIGLIVKSANVIDEKRTQNTSMQPTEIIEYTFKFDQGVLSGDTLNPDDFYIKFHGYVDKVEDMYDFGSESDYNHYVLKRERKTETP